jgi:hypothetical protein
MKEICFIRSTGRYGFCLTRFYWCLLGWWH